VKHKQAPCRAQLPSFCVIREESLRGFCVQRRQQRNACKYPYDRSSFEHRLTVGFYSPTFVG
jgi:hypothetical protein